MLEEEIGLRLIGKITLEYPEIEQLKLRDIILEVLSKYEINSKETSLVISDIPDRAMLYLASKKIDGLSPKTLYSYKLHLERFSRYVVKPLNFITANDIKGISCCNI